MSSNGYLNFPLGPYEAELMARNRRNEALKQNSISHTQKKYVSAKANNSQIVELKAKLLTLKNQEKTCEQYMYETCNKLSQKEKIIAKEQNELRELCSYSKKIEQELNEIRNCMIQIKQQITIKEKSQNTYTNSTQNATINSSLPTTIPENYMPSEDTIELLRQFQGVPIDYIEEKLIEFRIYYLETKEQRKGWDRCFYTWVIRGWKKERYDEKISQDFTPSEESLQFLIDQGIKLDFCQQETPKFIIYWYERQDGCTPRIWQERFKQWIERSWRRHKINEDRAKFSRPTTEEFTDTSWVGKYNFRFED